jgi:hypothetical protein
VTQEAASCTLSERLQSRSLRILRAIDPLALKCWRLASDAAQTFGEGVLDMREAEEGGLLLDKQS